MRHQRGYIFEASGALHVRYYTVVDGVRKQKSHKLCDKDREAGCGAPSAKKVRELCEDFMRQVNGDVTNTSHLTVVEFWEKTYLPFITENLKPSTINGYKQIWNCHLKKHFGTSIITDYKTPNMTILLTNLSKTLKPRTIAHVKFLSSSVFSHAVALGVCAYNPIRDAQVLGKTLQNGETEAYTLEEMLQIISALKSHVDCQLIMALAYFCGLRKGEITGLQWGDVDDKYIHVRRAVVRGVVGTPKTLKSCRSIPIIAPVRSALEMWRGGKTEGWIFPNENGEPLNLHHVACRTIRPVLTEAKLPWRGFHAGRRGLGTALRTLTGNSNAGRDMLGHSDDKVTKEHYEGAMPDEVLKGMKLLEAQVVNK